MSTVNVKRKETSPTITQFRTEFINRIMHLNKVFLVLAIMFGIPHISAGNMLQRQVLMTASEFCGMYPVLCSSPQIRGRNSLDLGGEDIISACCRWWNI